MAPFTIIIGNKNYSSWSLRGWLALKACGVEFDEVMVLLDKPDTSALIRAHSPAGKVPALIHGDDLIWDSLAICEYLAETFPDAGLWPDEAHARAHARCVAAEVHSGFADLRRDMPMNCRAALPGLGASPEALADIVRVEAIWSECREKYGAGGDFLYGSFTAADAMFAPIASRLKTYQPNIGPTATAYVATIHGHPAMAEWCAAARDEADVLDGVEVT